MKKRTLIRPCMVCSSPVPNIRGVVTYDADCCSDKCYVTVAVEDMRPSVVNVSKPLKRRKAVKARRRAKKGASSFYLTDEWLKLRYTVIKTYGRSCMACGKVKGPMHVDHIKPRSKHPDLALAFENMQVLCQACNYGKGTWDKTDFRPKLVTG